MQTPWKPIFDYQLNAETNAQAVYNELFKLALTYKYRKSGGLIVPVDNKSLTKAIFGLNGRDKFTIEGKEVNGHKVKELFITTIFLKHLEKTFEKGSYFFIVIPPNETSCDVAIIVSKTKAKPSLNDPSSFKLTEDHLPFLFQIKEYVNFKELTGDQILAPSKIDVKKIEKMTKQYSENVLVLLRSFIDYSDKDLSSFFTQNPNCYLISMPTEILKDGELIKLNPDKHNYIITFPKETFSIVEFNRPSCLTEFKIKNY